MYIWNHCISTITWCIFYSQLSCFLEAYQGCHLHEINISSRVHETWNFASSLARLFPSSITCKTLGWKSERKSRKGNVLSRHREPSGHEACGPGAEGGAAGLSIQPQPGVSRGRPVSRVTESNKKLTISSQSITVSIWVDTAIKSISLPQSSECHESVKPLLCL